jgi:hypothetical protein
MMHVPSRRARLNPWKVLRSAAGAFDLPSILVGVVVQPGPQRPGHEQDRTGHRI